jgi:hypothetical protein
MAVVTVIGKQVGGVPFTVRVDSVADHASVANNTSFLDLSDGLVYFKNSTGAIETIFSASASLPAWLESNATDLTIWNNGKGNDSTNTSFGEEALRLNTTGSLNTAIGSGALSSNTTGYGNTGIGTLALYSNVSSLFNTAIGYGTLRSNTTGNDNVAIGIEAAYTNTTGFANTIVGSQALRQNTTGGNNTAIGFQALLNNTTGGSNIALGAFTDSGNFSRSVIIGYLATATANNQFVVGSVGINAGAVTTEALVPTKAWAVKINGVDYKIPLQIA